MTDLTLGIDLGTSGVRTAVLDGNGAVLSSVKAPHPPQDIDHIVASKWWDAVRTCITSQATALADAGYAFDAIGRICVDGTSGTMVLTDANLTPMTPALMYDSSGFDREAETIAEFAPDVHITKGSNSALARALRLQSFDTSNHAVHLLHQADYIIAKLRGVGGASDENNTLKLGYDPETGQWPDWFNETGLRSDLLPDVQPAGAPLGPISASLAQDLNLNPEVMIHAGTTDSIAAFLAASPLVVGSAVTSLGTTLALKILSKQRIDLPDMGLYSHKIGDAWLVGGASNTGGGVLAKFFDAPALANLSEKIDPTQASPLDYYPLNKPGERFPVNDPTLEPRLSPRPDDDAAFLHGIFESIARIERDGYTSISEHGGPQIKQLFTAGGGANNPVWGAIRERVLGVKLSNAASLEACVGSARLALAHSAN